jgi:hypothetical protein
VFAFRANCQSFQAVFTRRFRLAIALCTLAITFLGGCKTKEFTDPIFGPDYSPTNAFRKWPVLPAELRRVAVLPMSYNELDASAPSGEQTLEPMLQAELTKTARFEAIFLKPSQVQLWTGKERWNSSDDLPPDILKVLAQKTGCDGVLFVRLSQYKAYPPILIGWQMKLVSKEADILWAVDELFDAAEEAVSNSARRFDRGRVRNNPALEDSRSILLSPTKFGQYTLHAVFQTLPER